MPIVPVMHAAAGSVITSLVGSGVQRLGSLAFQKIMRIAKIDSALKGAVTRSTSIRTAVNDFEIVIGSRYGELTQELFNFLREVERSGIVNTMVENALIDRNSSELKRIFYDLHQKVIGNGVGDSDLLFDKMMTSFSVTLEELCKDKILLDAFRLHQSDLASRLDRVDLALVELTKGAAKSVSSFASIEATCLKIAKGLQAAYRSIRVETNKGARPVDITRIYIPPKLRYRDTKNNEKKVSAIVRILGTAPQSSTRAEALNVHQDAVREQLSSINYSDLRVSFRRVVILGDPGGGKSTLCQHLCHDLAKQAVASLQTESPQLTPQLQKVPIRITLRTYEKARTSEPQLTISEFMVRDLKNHVNAEADEIRDALEYLLASGSAVLAFDGLDEILATAQRRDFVDLVQAFCNQFPLCPTLVTSRLVGYDDAPLSSQFDELILERFENDEILDYVAKFMKVVGGHPEKEAKKRASNFYKQTTSNAADLRRNPLMLGLMAWLFNMRGDVPSNRPEIYRECAVLMFEKWDPDRDIKANIPSSFDRLQLFSSIASKIFGHPELSAGVEGQWLDKEVRSFFYAVYENKAQAYEAAKALVAFITGRAWVMTDMGDNIFAFTHQTFLEYFFARHIDDMYDTVKEVLDLVIPRILRREWDMVSHLSLQIKTHRNLRKQNEALDQLRTLILSRMADKLKGALVSFVSRCLEYLAGAETNIKAVVTVIVDYAIDSAIAGDSSAWEDVSQCAQACVERREFVRDIIVKRLTEEFRRGSSRSFAIRDAISQSESVPRVLWDEQRRLPAELSDTVRKTLKSFILDRVEHDAFLATTAWHWYGRANKDLIKRHGIESYFNSRFHTYAGVDGISIMAVRASRQLNLIMPSHISRKKASDFIAWVGAIGYAMLPLRKDGFNLKPGDGFELWIWDRVLHDKTLTPVQASGVLFIMMVATELQNRQREEGRENPRSKKRSYSRSEIIQWALENTGIKDLSFVGRIKAAAEANTLFR